MHEYADDMDLGGPDGGGEDLRVQRFYTGRGLWKPPSNMQRIGRQEARMIASAIHNDSSGQMHRILSSSQSTLFESLRRTPSPQRCDARPPRLLSGVGGGDSTQEARSGFHIATRGASLAKAIPPRSSPTPHLVYVAYLNYRRWSNGYAPRRGTGHSTMDHTGRSMLSNITHKSSLATQNLSNTLSPTVRGPPS